MFLKIPLLFVCWLLLVSVSAYFTITGLGVSYPGDHLEYAWALGLTDVEILGIALVIGQYSAIHIGISLVVNKNRRDILVGILSLVMAAGLTVSNVAFAYVSISQKHSTVEVADTTSDRRMELTQKRIDDLEATKKELQATVTAIPANHSTNRLKQQQAIQPQLNSIAEQLNKLNDDLLTMTEQAESTKAAAAGSNQLNTTFNLFGYQPNKVIAWLLAISLDPLAVIVLMSLTSYSQTYREQRLAERKRAKSHFLSNVLRLSREALPANEPVRKPHEVVVHEDTDPVQVTKIPRIPRNG